MSVDTAVNHLCVFYLRDIFSHARFDHLILNQIFPSFLPSSSLLSRGTTVTRRHLRRINLRITRGVEGEKEKKKEKEKRWEKKWKEGGKRVMDRVTERSDFPYS